MTAADAATAHDHIDCAMVAPPQLESTTPPAEKKERSNRAVMPRLSQAAPGWFAGNHGPVGESVERGQQCGGHGDEGVVALHRRKALRTRAAPLGPHPYLDRFASGMHRPLEGGKPILCMQRLRCVYDIQ